MLATNKYGRFWQSFSKSVINFLILFAIVLKALFLSLNAEGNVTFFFKEDFHIYFMKFWYSRVFMQGWMRACLILLRGRSHAGVKLQIILMESQSVEQMLWDLLCVHTEHKVCESYFLFKAYRLQFFLHFIHAQLEHPLEMASIHKGYCYMWFPYRYIVIFTPLPSDIPYCYILNQLRPSQWGKRCLQDAIMSSKIIYILLLHSKRNLTNFHIVGSKA